MADPLDVLRLEAAPVAPDPAFATRLRARLVEALGPDPTDPADVPDVSLRGGATVTATEPATTHALTPYLAVHDAAAALDWYRDALGAIETFRFVDPADGRVGHAEVVIGGARLMLSDAYPELGMPSPLEQEGHSSTLHLEVVDVDFSHEQAVTAGATSERAPADQFHGNRNAVIVDPFGHRWMLTQAIDAERAAAASEEQGLHLDQGMTGRRPVEPGYITMRTADLERARAFFGALFAWQVEPGSQEGGGHVANTRFPMGFMESPGTDADADVPPVTLYFRVDDIEPYAARVVELGGQVLATNEHPSGGNAECVDDQGFRFDLFRPAPGY